jgi:3-hydroxyacyl-CoA dehydrogenase
MSNYKVTVLGAGLAGCEAALWLAGKGVQVELYEQKPAHFSPAHKSEGFAELICSNSLKAERLDSASGLLKDANKEPSQKTDLDKLLKKATPLKPIENLPSTGVDTILKIVSDIYLKMKKNPEFQQEIMKEVSKKTY